jgi:excisionase family DNA binding protein
MASKRGRLFTVGEAAAYINVGERMIRRLIAERRVPIHRIGRHVRLAESDLDRFIEAGREDFE